MNVKGWYLKITAPVKSRETKSGIFLNINFRSFYLLASTEIRKICLSQWQQLYCRQRLGVLRTSRSLYILQPNRTALRCGHAIYRTRAIHKIKQHTERSLRMKILTMARAVLRFAPCCICGATMIPVASAIHKKHRPPQILPFAHSSSLLEDSSADILSIYGR